MPVVSHPTVIYADNIRSLSPVNNEESRGGSGTWEETQFQSVRRKLQGSLIIHSFTQQLFVENILPPGTVPGASYSKMISPECLALLSTARAKERIRSVTRDNGGEPGKKGSGSGKEIPKTPEKGQAGEPKHRFI